MKKFVALFVSLLLFCCCFVGCEDNNSENQQTVITLSKSNYEKYFNFDNVLVSSSGGMNITYSYKMYITGALSGAIYSDCVITYYAGKKVNKTAELNIAGNVVISYSRSSSYENIGNEEFTITDVSGEIYI